MRVHARPNKKIASWYSITTFGWQKLRPLVRGLRRNYVSELYCGVRRTYILRAYTAACLPASFELPNCEQPLPGRLTNDSTSSELAITKN